jgi:hypothetical protein
MNGMVNINNNTAIGTDAIANAFINTVVCIVENHYQPSGLIHSPLRKFGQKRDRKHSIQRGPKRGPKHAYKRARKYGHERDLKSSPQRGRQRPYKRKVLV